MRKQNQATLVVLAGAAVTLTAWVSPTGAATARDSKFQPNLEATVRYLQEEQNTDGGFGGNAGEESNQDFSGWVALALAAAGINPRDQTPAGRHYEGGKNVYSYLTEHAARALPKELCQPIICTTAFERELLVVDASGTDPHDFGGIDLVRDLLARQLPEGSFPFVPDGKGEVNDTVFAILSLSIVQEPAARVALKPSAEWLIGQQNEDGGWAWRDKGSPSEADLTGAAIQALVAAGIHSTEVTKAETTALRFLHEIQDLDGGFPEFATERESNVASTAWATQGLWALGENPENWTLQTSSPEPLDYMESMQQQDGHIRYRASEESNGVWMTAYVAPAFAGQPLPIPEVPYVALPPAPTEASTGAASTSPVGSGAGQGGESVKAGSGVIAGGGGTHAPLFSRPQPHSQGHTPGGARLLSKKHAKERHTHKRNPGRSRKTPIPDLAAQRDAGRSALKAGRGNGGGQAGGQLVRGILIGNASDAGYHTALGSGAPGLHSAGAGGDEARWPTIAVEGLIVLLVLAGSQLERRRPEMIL